MTEKKEITKKGDERMWIVPAALATFISLSGVIYTIYLGFIGIISSYDILVLYGFLLWFPVSMIVCFGTYEIAFNMKIKEPFLFHVKRFLSRMTVILGYMLCFMVFWSLLSPLMFWRYALLITLFLTSLTLSVLVAIPKTRHIIKKFTEAE